MANKVTRRYSGIEDQLPASSSVASTGWYPGQFGCKNATDGTMELYDGTQDEVYGMIIDDDNELRNPPTGNLVTIVGGMAKMEVQNSAVNESYVNTTWQLMDTIYVDTNARMTPHYNATATVGSGSIRVGACYQVPTANNSYTIGVLLRL